MPTTWSSSGKDAMDTILTASPAASSFTICSVGWKKPSQTTGTLDRMFCVWPLISRVVKRLNPKTNPAKQVLRAVLCAQPLAPGDCWDRLQHHLGPDSELAAANSEKVLNLGTKQNVICPAWRLPSLTRLYFPCGPLASNESSEVSYALHEFVLECSYLHLPRLVSYSLLCLACPDAPGQARGWLKPWRSKSVMQKPSYRCSHSWASSKTATPSHPPTTPRRHNAPSVPAKLCRMQPTLSWCCTTAAETIWGCSRCSTRSRWSSLVSPTRRSRCLSSRRWKSSTGSSSKAATLRQSVGSLKLQLRVRQRGESLWSILMVFPCGKLYSSQLCLKEFPTLVLFTCHRTNFVRRNQ